MQSVVQRCFQIMTARNGSQWRRSSDVVIYAGLVRHGSRVSDSAPADDRSRRSRAAEAAYAADSEVDFLRRSRLDGSAEQALGSFRIFSHRLRGVPESEALGSFRIFLPSGADRSRWSERFFSIRNRRGWRAGRALGLFRNFFARVEAVPES